MITEGLKIEPVERSTGLLFFAETENKRYFAGD